MFRLNLSFVKCGRYKPVCFFFVHFGYVPCGNTLFAAGAEQCPVVKGKINAAIDNSVVVHFYKIAFAGLLIVRNEAFAISAADFQNMAAFNFSATWVFEYFHIFNISSAFLLLRPGS